MAVALYLKYRIITCFGHVSKYQMVALVQVQSCSVYKGKRTENEL